MGCAIVCLALRGCANRGLKELHAAAPQQGLKELYAAQPQQGA